MPSFMDIVRRAGGLATPAAEAKAWPLAGIGRTGPETIYGRTSINLTRNVFASYEQLYRSQPWVYVCVNKLSRGIGRLPLKTYERNEEDRDRARRDHPLAKLIRRPYPRTATQGLLEATVGSLAIYGNALWVKWAPRPGMPPEEVWPLDWSRVSIVAGDSSPIDHFLYQGHGGERRFRPEDVVHFAWWSPAGDLGVSPLEPLRRTLTLEDAAQRDAIASFENGMNPGGALRTEGSLTEEQKAELRASLTAKHEGPENARRWLLLEGGLDAKTFGFTAEEAQAIEYRKLDREEVAAVYDIPPPIIGILDQATFSNITEQHRMLYMDTLGPWLTMIEETIAAQLIEPEPSWGDVFVEFDLNEVLKGDVKERADAYQGFVMSGVLTPNEVRSLENRPPLPGGDDLLVPQNLRRATSPDTTQDSPAPMSDDEAVAAMVGANGNGNGGSA